MRLRRIWATSAMAVAGLALAAGAAQAAFPGTNGVLAVSAETATGDSDIFLADPAGVRAPEDLTRTPNVWEVGPAWSADGARLAFLRGVEDGFGNVRYSVAVMGSGGQDLQVLPGVTMDEPWENALSWAPDGRRLVAVGGDADEQRLVLMGVAAGVPRTVAVGPAADRLGWPAWSPDGRRIVFASDHGDPAPGAGDSTDLYVMNADGSGLRRLTRDADDDIQPEWTPDGRSVVWRDGNGISRMAVDGGTVTRLNVGDAGQPSLSPDGTRMSFLRDPEDAPRLMMAAADGSGAVPVLSAELSDGAQVDWQPLPAAPAPVPAVTVVSVNAPVVSIAGVAQANRGVRWTVRGAGATLRRGAARGRNVDVEYRLRVARVVATDTTVVGTLTVTNPNGRPAWAGVAVKAAGVPCEAGNGRGTLLAARETRAVPFRCTLTTTNAASAANAATVDVTGDVSWVVGTARGVRQASARIEVSGGGVVVPNAIPVWVVAVPPKGRTRVLGVLTNGGTLRFTRRIPVGKACRPVKEQVNVLAWGAPKATTPLATTVTTAKVCPGA